MRLKTLFVLASTLFLSAAGAPHNPTRQLQKGTIVSPANGTPISPGATFDFEYTTMADFGVSSYNYTVWLLTSAPSTVFAQSQNFAGGYFFGRFSQPNFPGNPDPKNPPPETLTMPDFSKNPGGFGVGAPMTNGAFSLVVMEEYASGDGSVGMRIALAMNKIVYNATRAS
ncbi:hypothetical protein MKEN_00920300 [Mycena kentingensis (nom. inval.)]|nr:hypothetical protein MKEN_00920300 [Mycena kentingensis (nom. inval.)]